LQQAVANNIEIWLVVPSTFVLRVLALMGLDRQLPVYLTRTGRWHTVTMTEVEDDTWPKPAIGPTRLSVQLGRPANLIPRRPDASFDRNRHFGHTVNARQAPRHVVRQRGYLCHSWQ
jgi:hypothetical protein